MIASARPHFVVPARPRWLVCLVATFTLVAAGGALLYLWFGWCTFPLFDWNEFRVAPAFALRHGTTVYPPVGGGPLSTWIYGPAGIIVNLPATFATSAAGALQIAAATNLLLLIAPLAWLCGQSHALRQAGWLAGASAFSLGVLSLPPHALLYFVSDHVAVACGIVSCWYLARSREAGGGTRALSAAAFWCLLSIAAKQLSVFLPVAQLLFLAWAERDRPAALRYLGRLALGGAAVGLVTVACFGFSALWLNLVQIPGALPWADVTAKLSLRYSHLLAFVAAPLAALLLTRGFRPLRAHPTTEARFLACSGLAFLVFLPIGLLSFFKIGGDVNALHSWSYLCPALLLTGIPWLFQTTRTFFWPGILTVALLVLRAPNFVPLPAGPALAHLAAADRIAREFPARVWFPNNPLVTWFTDRRLYHAEDGIATRHLAGFGLREADFKRHLPHPLSAVVYASANRAPFALPLLGFKPQPATGYWTIYTPVEAVSPAPPARE